MDQPFDLFARTNYEQLVQEFFKWNVSTCQLVAALQKLFKVSDCINKQLIFNETNKLAYYNSVAHTGTQSYIEIKLEQFKRREREEREREREILVEKSCHFVKKT